RPLAPGARRVRARGGRPPRDQRTRGALRAGGPRPAGSGLGRRPGVRRPRGTCGVEGARSLVTSVPGERYGLVGRGRLAPGYAADLVCFDPRRVGTRPTTMVYDLPQRQRRLLQGAEGVEHVFVNGVAVVERGVPTARRPGRVLRGGRWPGKGGGSRRA